MREISLTKGMVAFVDDEDFERVSQYRWYAEPHRRTYYASRKGKPTRRMHRFILNDPPFNVDHKDGNGLNNQRTNLRSAGLRGNQRNARRRVDNTSGYKGVCLHSFGKGWQAAIQHRYIGMFKTAEDAARAYDRKAIEIFGNYARLNFPRSDYE